MDNNQRAFFELLKAGLWGDQRSVQEFNVQEFKGVDWERVYQLAQEQSIQGVVLRGIEELRAKGLELSVPRVLLLQWIGEVRVIEQQNKDMNAFVAELFGQLREAGVNAVLVKGQGIALCYEKPLWRSSGDVDLLLTEENYEKAKKTLIPLASSVEHEYTHFKHQGMVIDGWVVELHGTLHSRLSKRIDSVVDEVQKDCFFSGNVRSEEFKSSKGSSVQVFLPSPDNDVIFVFTHILHHFFIDGIGLRQICDWCRLLWTFRDSLNHRLLESRIRKMGLMSEWKAFAAFAIEYLGMPQEAMPLYDVRWMRDDVGWKKKAERIMEFIMMSGNFGHNIEWKRSDVFVWNKTLALWSKLKNFCRQAKVFPMDSFRFFFHFVGDGLYAAVRGE